MFEMWFLTVFGLMCSSPAITALSLPFAISFRTWISRSESSARIVRPANLSRHSPGKGLAVVPTSNGSQLAVINVLGSLFLLYAIVLVARLPIL